jgi:hypothetical protein
MHFCRADIAIGGDRNNIFHAGDFSPISWPEIAVLQFVHGDDAVDNVEPFTQVDQSPRAERQRLLYKYGEKVILDVFARQNPTDMEAPKVKLTDGLPWLNPITFKQELTGQVGSTYEAPALPEMPVDDTPVALAGAEETPLEYYDAPPEPTRRRR